MFYGAVVFYLVIVLVVAVQVEVVGSLAYAPNFISKIIESDLKQQEEHQQQRQPEVVEVSDDEDSTTTKTPPLLMIRTRFPPEPNGYLHLGHAKAVCFNYAMARQYGGKFHMRLDDTNPLKENEEYVESILEDVQWILSATNPTDRDPWDGPVRSTSSYFDIIERCAQSLLESGDAFIDSCTPEQIRTYRGTLTQPGQDSPYRSTRSVGQNLQLFQEMKAGYHPPGSHVVRAKISMASPNINLRDPILYRILDIPPTEPQQQQQQQPRYYQLLPMYDFSHPIADALEGITHSLCSLEFEDHRPFYEWTLHKLFGRGIIEPYQKRHMEDPPPPVLFPKQIEFSRLNLKYTVLSKRKLIKLVQERVVTGWSDPRMPTISGVRRRGVPPQALQLFNERNGVSKVDSFMEISGLEDATREVMDKLCPRAFGILHPLRITLSNFPTTSGRNTDTVGEVLEYLKAPSYPSTSSNSTVTKQEETLLMRTIPFGSNLFIEQEDFFDTELNGPAPKGWKRLLPGGMVRLKYAYVITCEEVRRDPITNKPIELICSYDPSTRGGQPPSSSTAGSSKERPGIIHWLESSTAIPCHVNLYDRLFQVEEPGGSSSSGISTTLSSSTTLEDDDNDDNNNPSKDSFLKDVNPYSLEILTNCYVEPSVQKDALELLSRLQSQEQQQQAGNNDTHGKKLYASNLSYQWERNGYFSLEEESTPDKLIFNRVVTLRDTWKKKEQPEIRSRGSSSASKQNNPSGGDIGRIAFRTGKIVSVQPHPNASSLVLCTVSCSDGSSPRTAIVGNVPIHILEDLVQEPGSSKVSRNVVIVTNLKPAKLAGIESTATLLAATSNLTDEDGGTVLEILTTTAAGSSSPDEDLLLCFEHCGEPQPDEMLKNKGALKVWDRVKAALKVNKDGEVVYCDNDGRECRMLKGKGDPVVLQRVKNGVIQ